MSVLGLNYRDRLNWNFGGISILDNEVVVGIDQVVAVGATKKRSGIQHGGICKGMTGIEFFMQLALATRTGKALVKIFEFFCLWPKYIFMAFYGGKNINWIHLFEHAHKTTVNMIG
jgi:uncharacterized membrane protein